MSLQIKITARKWRQYLRDAPTLYVKEVRSALREVNLLFEREIRIKTAVGATKILRGSVFEEIIGTPKTLTGVVAYDKNKAIYGEPVDLGTRPHFPPVGPLKLWVRRVLSIGNEKQISSIAWAIAKTISRRGTKAKNVIKNAFNNNRNRALRIFEEAAKRISEG